VIDGADFHGRVGLLAIDPLNRTRIRVNGSGDGPRVQTEQVFGNCPKYIQRRVPVAVEPRQTIRSERPSLSPADRATVLAADTFFIASAGPTGLDVSHRGGQPGFVEVDGDRLWFPDYTGNRMFMTLGNLVADGRAGLLFLDWESGDTLQLSGRGTVGFEPRGVAFEVERVIHTRGAVPLRWALLERSRFNPPVRSEDVPQHPDAPQLRTAGHE
jgi:predicted pyridoxine 5'-phosphate oxidase superfamily flavin-nucleotide-binding protein